MRWSPKELSGFFGSSIAPPPSRGVPHILRFKDDLISGELWIRSKKNEMLVMVRRASTRQELFEFSVPCKMIKTDILTGGTPALFFFAGDVAKTEECWLYITKDKERWFAFYPAMRSAWNNKTARTNAEHGAPPNGGHATPSGNRKPQSGRHR